jgi:hypothetical protein
MVATTRLDEKGSAIRWELAAGAARLLGSSQGFEQDLPAGQGDVGAFETHQRCRTFGHFGGIEMIDVDDETESAGSGKNAACSWGMGRHDFIEVVATRIQWLRR